MPCSGSKGGGPPPPPPPPPPPRAAPAARPTRAAAHAPRRRQRKGECRNQAPEQRSPCPEKMQEGFVRHFARIELAHQIPGERRIQEIGSTPRLHERRNKPIHIGQLGKAPGAQEKINRLVKFGLIESARPRPTRAAVGLTEIEMMQPREIRERAILCGGRRRFRQDRHHSELQILLTPNEPMHPGRDSA